MNRLLYLFKNQILMKKITAFLFLIAITMGCGVRQTRDYVTTGDYDAAIQNAVEGLRGNKNAKGKQDYIYLLEEAFAKAKERDLRNIQAWVKDANPQKLEKIYSTYLQMNDRQELIRPLLPLKFIKENKNAQFPFDDYSDQIVSSKNALSRFLYDNSKALLVTKDKMTLRRAYDDLTYLESINPNFKDTNKLIEEARFKGTDFVSVYSKNETNMVIPVRLENDLLDFSTYGLNDKWTVYHSNKQKGITYDFGIIVNFREINISPEQIKERQFEKEKQIKDGLKNLLDANGNVVKDSLGKPIKVDNMKTIKISIYEFSQIKSTQVVAKVDYIDFTTNQLLQSFPLASEFVFTNTYATYQGDKRATDESYYPTFNQRAMPFPTNEQMVYDTGNDLKAKLKDIISRNKIRR